MKTALDVWSSKGRWDDILHAGARDMAASTIFDKMYQSPLFVSLFSATPYLLLPCISLSTARIIRHTRRERRASCFIMRASCLIKHEGEGGPPWWVKVHLLTHSPPHPLTLPCPLWSWPSGLSSLYAMQKSLYNAWPVGELPQLMC